VASGLVPNKPKGDHAQAGTHGLNPGDFGSTSADDFERTVGPDVQPDLSGMSVQDIARGNLHAALEQFSEIAGVGQLVHPAGLRYGFYVELPQPEFLGVSHEDLPVQAWWFLANLSGQLLVDDGVLDATGENGLLIPDTGDQGYRFAATNEDIWPTAVVERLGGSTLMGFEFIHHLLTQAAHPLSDAAYALFNACRSFAAAEAEQGG
jgi:hypothetical protein